MASIAITESRLLPGLDIGMRLSAKTKAEGCHTVDKAGTRGRCYGAKDSQTRGDGRPPTSIVFEAMTTLAFAPSQRSMPTHAADWREKL